MVAALDTTALLALLARGELVLLPNARAARALRSRFDQQQWESGLRAWEPPSVFTWDEWTESLWSALLLEGADERILLNRLQEESLWIEVITASAEGAQLTSGGARELAALSRSGLALTAAHNALPRLRSAADSSDAKAFVNWQAAFLERSHTGRFLSRALLDTALDEHLRSRRLALPPSLHLAGFERLTPARRTLLETLQLSGCSVILHALVNQSTASRIHGSVIAPDPHAELDWAVRWIRRHLDGTTGSSLGGVALLLPNPAAERTALEPLLREVLAPELGAVGIDLSSTPWQFGSGPPLAGLLLIQHALLLLSWVEAALPLESVAALLLSPFLAHTEAYEARARFEMHGLRRTTLLLPELSLEALLRIAKDERRGAPLHLPEFQALSQLAGSGRTLSGNGSHADWTELIRKLLRSVGWPGPRTLTAEEYQATEAWESILDLVATLDVAGRRVSFTEILHLLEREVLAAPGPDSGVNAPVQIMRLDDAEGCIFDAAILVRATDTALPPIEHAHPLVYWSLQRSLNLPGTDPALSFTRSREALQALGRRCGDLLLVSAEADETGPLRLSPLAAQLGFTALDPESLVVPRPAFVPLTPAWASDATPLPSLPSSPVAGGARLLELQAACGFRAFAELRLGAAMPEGKTLGLNARESGSVLHSALEFFWIEVQTQEALKSFSIAERDAVVQRSVAHAFARLRLRVSPEDTWTDAYLDVLQQRLCSVLSRWLQHELQRTPFRVLPPEQKQTVTVGPLELSIRPDRIDSVEGGFALIDYKTSFALSTNDWLGERPDAPQLPLYALLGDTDEFRALAFARVRPGKAMAWLSLEDQPGIFPPKRGGALHDITGQIELWRTELNRLADDFAAGRSEVNPKTFPRTCQYCQQRLLCRLDAAALLANAPETVDGCTESQDG